MSDIEIKNVTLLSQYHPLSPPWSEHVPVPSESGENIFSFKLAGQLLIAPPFGAPSSVVEKE